VALVTTCLPWDNTFAKPIQTNIVLKVTIIDGTPIFTMIKPLINPIAIPTKMLIMRLIKILSVFRNVTENMNPENAMIAGKERSISPAVTTNVNPNAIMSEKGIVERKDI